MNIYLEKIIQKIINFLQKSNNFFIYNKIYSLEMYLNRNKKISCEVRETFYDKTLPKIFVIGHNKTGTTSLYNLFINNRYKSYHWEKGILSHRIKQNFLSNSPLLKGIEDAHLYSDIECGYGLSYEYNLFPQLDLQYPNSFFIYNYRDVEDWIVSRTRHLKNKYIKFCIHNLNRNYGFNLKTQDDIHNHWRNVYSYHDKLIRKYFMNKNNLLILNLDDRNSKINVCSKLIDIGFKLKESTIPHSFKTY